MIVELAKPEEFVPANGTDSGLSLLDDTTSSRRHDPATAPKDIVHDLQSLGSQFSASAEIHVMSPFTKEEAKERPACQYHSRIFQRLVSVDIVHKDRDILERYLVESPGRQYAVFYRVGTEYLSTSRNCTCYSVHDFHL
ncbi:23bf9aa2-8ac6-42be-9802-1bd6d7a97446 [Sclerotinia trifoliorum]|uniref:23bf9aa2-8ac6-42be-9802-1bd6d7a97446 n=1 Tax=Sclerotinia trifoliorum TaxID=28548 RepID=A0A8H2ZMZ4_9HELO|nr:23bf9aa2-8ac6-42be-9802-1bd6d7a97446 [Sclerotinia trifoliorum]